jgi:hypothetical protein|tara:strand:+ start:243 stop:344 length:102 start_codon:yes stop_codon:yes gene_type:complete
MNEDQREIIIPFSDNKLVKINGTGADKESASPT